MVVGVGKFIALQRMMVRNNLIFSPLSTHFLGSLQRFIGEEPIKINDGAFGTFFVATEKIFSLR